MEYQEFYQKLGAAIRAFRKLQNMTQKDLAQRLNRSLACVSKYEKGGVAIDVFTIYEIAAALSISPQMLLPSEGQSVQSDTLSENLPTIFRQRYLYMYLYVGERHAIVPCCMEIQHDNAHVVLYVEPQDIHDRKSCKYLMAGEITCCETNVVVNTTNPLIPGDLVLMCFSRINLIQGRNIGICTTVTPTYRFRSAKCYLSAQPVTNTETLKEQLFFTKGEISYIRKNHSLLV